MSYQDYARPAQEAAWGLKFGARLRRIMDERGLNPTQFARKVGIPKSSIDKYREGSSIPNYYRIKIIADELGMTVEKLADTSPFADLDDLEDDDEE